MSSHNDGASGSTAAAASVTASSGSYSTTMRSAASAAAAGVSAMAAATMSPAKRTRPSAITGSCVPRLGEPSAFSRTRSTSPAIME